MITDPKLNDIPADEQERSRHTKREGVRPQGLSVNDTIARDANLSVGGQGVNVSGVSAGSGAGAGSTSLTPSTGGSPAPRIVPGARSTGMTPLGETQSSKSLGSRLDLGEDPIAHDDIARRAYSCWHERGCPPGSPDEDWHRAERELRTERLRRTSAASA